MEENTRIYEVVVTASVQLLVEATSEDEAAEIAYEQVDFDYASVKDVVVEDEADSEQKLLSLEASADQVIYM